MVALNFENNFKQHSNELNSFAFKLTHNKMDADDLVQETAIKAYSSFDNFKADSSFKNWSFTIMKNTFITKYNKRKKKNIVSTSVDELEYAIAPTSYIQDVIQENSTIKYLMECISELSIKTKTPFTMYLNGYSYEEIANYLEIPIGTVKSRINFARKKLKQKFLDATDPDLIENVEVSVNLRARRAQNPSMSCISVDKS